MSRYLVFLSVSVALLASTRQDKVEPSPQENESQNVPCSRVCSDASVFLENADAEPLLAAVASNSSRCTCMEALARDAAEYFYQRGLEAGKKGDLAGALKELQVAAKLDPAHPTVAATIEATRDQVKTAAEKLLQQWRSDMAAGQYGLAAALYRQINHTDGNNAPILEQMRAGYRQQLTTAIQLWNDGCSSGDVLLRERARRQAAEIIPDPELEKSLTSEWMRCEKTP